MSTNIAASWYIDGQVTQVRPSGDEKLCEKRLYLLFRFWIWKGGTVGLLEAPSDVNIVNLQLEEVRQLDLTAGFDSENDPI